MEKEKSIPVKAKAAAITKKLKATNNCPKSTGDSTPDLASFRSGLKINPASCAERRLCKSAPSCVVALPSRGIRIPVREPQRLFHIRCPAARDTNAFGEPRYSSQYCSSRERISWVMGIPVSHSPHDSASDKPGNLGVQSLSSPSSRGSGIGTMVRNLKVAFCSRSFRRSPTEKYCKVTSSPTVRFKSRTAHSLSATSSSLKSSGRKATESGRTAETME